MVDAKTDQPLGNAVVSVSGKGAGRFLIRASSPARYIPVRGGPKEGAVLVP